jgi:hypothetical protein
MKVKWKKKKTKLHDVNVYFTQTNIS